MSDIACRYCSRSHPSVPEVKACFLSTRTDNARRIQAAEDAEDDRRMALRTVDHTGVRYESAEAQSKAAIEEVRRRLARKDFRVDAWSNTPEVASAFNEMVDTMGADVFEDAEVYSNDGVEHLTDGRHWYAEWTLSDERIRTPEQSTFALSEGQEAPPVSVYDVDYRPSGLDPLEPSESEYGTGPWQSIARTHIPAAAGEYHQLRPVKPYREPVDVEQPAKCGPQQHDRHVTYWRQLTAWQEADAAWWARHGGKR